jgi:hypothetical protein
MRLTVITDLSGTITRQDLNNMWSQATIPPLKSSDLDPSFTDIFRASSFSDVSVSLPNPDPGKLFFNQTSKIMYVWTDALDVNDTGDKTGVSLWLAVGPDSFETACLTAEPVPAGAFVEPHYDRWVKIFNPNGGQFVTGATEAPVPLGANQSGIFSEYTERLSYDDTAASGTWIRVGIDGYVRFWHPAADRVDTDPASGVSENFLRINVHTNQANYVGAPASPSKFLGAGIGNGNGATAAGPYTVGLTIHNVTVGSGYTASYPFMAWRGWGCERFNRNT